MWARASEGASRRRNAACATHSFELWKRRDEPGRADSNILPTCSFKCGFVVRKFRCPYMVRKTLFFFLNWTLEVWRSFQLLNGQLMAPCAPSGNICNPKAESHFLNGVAEPLPISPTYWPLARPPVMVTVSSRVTVICSNPALQCSAQSNWAPQCQTQSLSMVLKSQQYSFPSSWTCKIV